jgi:RNA polymerase sigma-70 factor (ECF subfamily)
LNILRPFHQSAISDPAIFALMYEHNRLSVFRYIYSLSGGPSDDAEDLTAETFIRAWKARHRFEGNVDSAISWLLGIARRLVIDDYRRKLVRKTVSLPSDLKANSTTEEDVLVLQQKQQLLHLLNNLPADQREILVLRYTLGWHVNQIAAHIGMSENNVSVIIHRTLAVLREQWSI